MGVMKNLDGLGLEGRTILQVLPALDAGGVERTALEITEALRQAGAKALIASEGGRLAAAIENVGGYLHTLPLASKNPFTLNANRKALIKLINEHAIELVHARSRAPAWSALWAARATRTPFVTTYHGVYSGKYWPKKLYNSVMIRGDIVIANSTFVADHIRTNYPNTKALVTIPRGVDITLFDPEKLDVRKLESMRKKLGMDGSKTCFLLPARLTAWKGQAETIKAFAALPPDVIARVQCVIAGDAQGRQSYVNHLKDLINTHQLGGVVHLHPHIDDMPHAIAVADWILAPSQRPEAFGRLAAEGAAMGKPVITTDIGGGLETVINAQTGYHIQPGQLPSFTSAIQNAVNLSDSARRKMGQNGLAHIRARYTKAKLQQDTLAVYAKLLNRKGTESTS